MSEEATAAPFSVIPAPFRATPASGSWMCGFDLTIAAPQPLVPVVALFVDELRADAELVATSVGEGEHADVVLELIGSVDADAAGIPLASGVRADGAAPAEADERYRLVVAPDGVRISAPTPEGAYRALTTLRQMIAAGGPDVPAVAIEDGPRFAWRGLSVDVARTFHDATTLRRVVDMCALYKLNVLHLHLTDDQGWRFEVPEWPELTGVGAAPTPDGRPGGHYTRAEIDELVRYATERFVTLVPEVDLPGHSRAAFRSYPELAPEASPEAESAQAYGLSIGTLDLDRGPTRRFVTDVFTAAAEQFPTSSYLHIGADEAFGMPADEHERFVDYSIATVRSLGRIPVGWQEAARAGVGADDVVQYWIEPTQLEGMFPSDGPDPQVQPPAELLGIPPEVLAVLAESFRVARDDVPSALAKGARILVSANSVLYLDRPHGDEAADEAQEAHRQRVGLKAYPAGTLREFVEWDVVDITPGIVDDSRIAGVEAAVWGETVTDRDDLEFLLLPRLPGVGERAWSRSPTEWSEYRERLAPAARVWDRRGWNWYRTTAVDWPEPSVVD